MSRRKIEELRAALARLNAACEPFVSYVEQTPNEEREMDAARDEALRLTDPTEWERCDPLALSGVVNGREKPSES